MAAPWEHHQQQITMAFGAAAETYGDRAPLQKFCAQLLLELLDPQLQLTGLRDGPILEIGCGTGFLTAGLIDRFGGIWPLEISDIAPEMVKVCEDRFQDSPYQPLQFQVLDGEALRSEGQQYALIASNFVIQWFRDPLASLLNLLQALLPGGWLVVSFPSCHSFRQFQQLCEKLDCPYPINPLPDPRPILGTLWPITQECLFQQHFIPVQYANPREFLRHFKAIGANTNLSGQHLSTVQLRQLLRTWEAQSPGEVEIDYHVALLAVQRKGGPVDPDPD